MNEKPTTVQGWLRWAEKAGYPWASAALGELERQRECPPTRPCVSLEYAILMGFEWCDSFEGATFWKNVYDSTRGIEWQPVTRIALTSEIRAALDAAGIEYEEEQP